MKKILIISIFILLYGLNGVCSEDFGIVPIEEDSNNSAIVEDNNPYDIGEDAVDSNDNIIKDYNQDINLNTTKKTVKHAKISVNETNYEDLKTNNKNDLSKYRLYNDGSQYQKKTTSYKKEKKFGKNTLGAKYDTSFSPNEMTQTRTLYSNYELTKKLSINSSYSNNSSGQFGQQSIGTFSLGPQYKFNRHVSLENIYSRNLSDKSTKGGLQLNLEPFKDDRMNINLGASQVQYDDGGPSRSQLNFGTQFKF